MKLRERYRILVINLLIALAISLIINFSYFVFRIMTPSGYLHRIPQFEGWFMTLEFLYSFMLAFALLSIANIRFSGSILGGRQLKRLLLATAVTLVFYMLAPRLNREGDLLLTFQMHRLYDPMQTLKCSFTLIVAILYGIIFDLSYQKQKITLENEKLKNENLKTTYNALVSQINPHFLFNSLNSLSLLVRESRTDDALSYIDRLSDTFRYVIQNSETGMTTLAEELEFLDSYKYLHEIRYAGKLFFDVKPDDRYADWLIPSLTLQPLIENAVKHNTITRNAPLTITIRTRDGKVEVSNQVRPKIETEGTGIGLRNLSARYLLLSGKDISITDDGSKFTVSLPLTPPIA